MHYPLFPPLLVAAAVFVAAFGCESPDESASNRPDNEKEVNFEELRKQMVSRQIRARGVDDERVLSAMRTIPRHRFVPAHQMANAYEDTPLPIGHRQTISQPYVVALMTDLANPSEDCKALDIGTGSGYQAAVLAQLCDKVYTIEIVEPLAARAKQLFSQLNYDNIVARHGDGYRGWPEHAPFDVIIVAAAPEHIPEPLIEQLAPGGTMVIPVGDFYQKLMVIQKDTEGEITRQEVAPVAFVPMTGQAESDDGR